MPLLFSGGKKHPGWLAVDMSDGHARFAYVRPGARRPQVVYCETRPCDPQDPRSLEHAAREFQPRRHQVTTLMQAQGYQLFVVEAPNVKPEEMRAAIRWRVKDLIDFHVDDAVVDVLDIPTPEGAAPRARLMCAVVAKAAAVREVVTRFERARLPLEVIDIAETAQRNVAALFESGERGVLTLGFDDGGGLITLTCGGELYFARRLDLGLAQLCDADEGRRQAAFERALVELQRSLDHVDRQFHYVPLDKVLLAPLPAPADALAAHLRPNVYAPVAEASLGEVLDLPVGWQPGEAARRGRWLALIGAGLRNESRAL